MLAARSLVKTVSRAKSDLISDVFVKTIRDLAQKQKTAGGLLNSCPKMKKQLDEQLNRLNKKYKLSSEIVGTLDLTFEKVEVESSVAMLLEGKDRV